MAAASGQANLVATDATMDPQAFPESLPGLIPLTGSRGKLVDALHRAIGRPGRRKLGLQVPQSQMLGVMLQRGSDGCRGRFRSV